MKRKDETKKKNDRNSDASKKTREKNTGRHKKEEMLM